MDSNIEEKLRIVLKEAFLHRSLLAVGFSLISISILTIGLFIPKYYQSSSTIIVDEHDIIQPLMEGRAVATDVRDPAEQARELIYSRRMLTRVIETTGPQNVLNSPLEQERLMDALRHSIVVETSADNLIVISYSDINPEKAKLIVEKVTDYFIEDSRLRKSEESRKAYEFVNSQVKEYHGKLVEAENKLKVFRSENVDAHAGAQADIARRIANLRSQIEETQLAISEEQIRRQSLENQLSGEAGLTVSMTREGQYLGRLAELQSELDMLLLSYTDTHPDVVVLKHQIEDLKSAIIKERERGQSSAGTSEAIMEEGIRLSPLYETLRGQLSQSKTLIATLKARLSENEKLMAREIELSKRVHSSEALLSELNRDYEVNQQIYNDLLRRRENARVSMNMDISQKGLNMKVYAPAYLPVKPTGLRLLHFLLGGITLGIAIPVGLLVLYLELDPRIRNKKLFERDFGLQVVSAVPRWVGRSEIKKAKAENMKVIFLIVLSLAISITISMARIKGIV